MKKDDKRWIIDRRIPIAVIITLLVQIGGMLIWATSLDARVISVEQKTANTAATNEKLARIEERLDSLRQETGQVKQQLNYLTSRLINK